MDPNSILSLVLDAEVSLQKEEDILYQMPHLKDIRDGLGILCDWLEKGGFTPTLPHGDVYVCSGFAGERFAYTLIGKPNEDVILNKLVRYEGATEVSRAYRLRR